MSTATQPRVRRVPRFDTCQEEGCTTRGMPCYLPGNYGRPDNFFCGEHAHKNGYCWGCGNFWAGVESFDFNLNGHELCDNCCGNPDLTGEWGEDTDDDYSDYDFEEALP